MRAHTRRSPILILPAMLILVVACASGKQPPDEGKVLETEVLLAGGQCGRSDPGPAVTRVDDESGLEKILGQLRSGRLGDRVERPEVDLTRESLLLVEMGQKPTAGYGIKMAGPADLSSEGALELRVRWIEPAPDAVTAQVITSPCLLVRLSSREWVTVRVLDQDGKERVGSGSTD